MVRILEDGATYADRIYATNDWNVGRSIEFSATRVHDDVVFETRVGFCGFTVGCRQCEGGIRFHVACVL